MGTCACTETAAYAAMEIGRGWMSSTKGGDAVEEGVTVVEGVTGVGRGAGDTGHQQMQSAELQLAWGWAAQGGESSRPIDAIWAAQGGRAVANRSNLGGAGRGEQPAREAAQGKRFRGLGQAAAGGGCASRGCYAS